MTDKAKVIYLSNALHFIVGFTQMAMEGDTAMERVNEVAWKALLDTGMAKKGENNE